MFFHRVNNAFINRLEFDFFHEYLERLCHALAKADSLQCSIGALLIEASRDVTIDYALIEFLGGLKPHTYETSMVGVLREDYVMLFKNDALRDSVSHVQYEVSNLRSAHFECQ